jgi:serine/threonine-protein kinase
MMTNRSAHGADAPLSRLRTQVRALFGPVRHEAPAASPPSDWRYEFQKEIGRGSRGTVYLARDRVGNRQVAIKILRGWPDWESRQRFWREAECASKLHHRNIVTIYDSGCFRGADFIAMEYVPGKTLDKLIPSDGLPLETALAYALQMAQAVATVHSSGMIHRDLKPANFIVSLSGAVKLLDFGLVKIVGATRRWSDCCLLPETPDGSIMGTVGYMSPEQVSGQPADPRSDIFAFGAVFYEILTGRRAFLEDSQVRTMIAILDKTPQPLPALIPSNVKRIVCRCLAKRPVDRYQAGASLLEELHGLPLIRRAVGRSSITTSVKIIAGRDCAGTVAAD